MAIRLSREEEYGIIALIDLSRNGVEVERVRAIADRQNIPTRFLEQIFSKLRQADIVVGKRGPTGGYKLSGNPNEITLSRVMEALRPTVQSADVVGRSSIAKAVSSFWTDIEESFNTTLEGLTLADLSDKASIFSEEVTETPSTTEIPAE